MELIHETDNINLRPKIGYHCIQDEEERGPVDVSEQHTLKANSER